ncbi:MAG TPA: VWA domain-containing protein [Leucothrix sp.]|nr:VWA domain-containing protein [Leucothrix sp.]
MSDTGLQFLSLYWLWLLLPFWAYLIAWYSKPRVFENPSIADVDVTANNHFYHPLVSQLISQLNQEPAKSDERKLPTSFWKKLVFWWYGLSISAIIFALAQPVLIGKRLPNPPPERDIVFLVDTSVSMQLKDYSLQGQAIKRMDLLRNLLNEFTTKMAGESISVIVFAEEPFMLVPLTHDNNLVQRMLSRVTTSLAGRYTAVGDALLMALKEANKQKERHQTFIVFTDADEARGKVSPTAAAKLVAESNIPIFTIAIGSSQKDKNKKVLGGLYQAVNLPLLKEVSAITGGESYQVHDSDAIKKALKSILKQRQNLAEVEPLYETEQLYYYPLLLGLLMLVLWQILRLSGRSYA